VIFPHCTVIIYSIYSLLLKEVYWANWTICSGSLLHLSNRSVEVDQHCVSVAPWGNHDEALWFYDMAATPVR